MSSAIYPSLMGRVVVVTGGGSGIGAALTEGFARQGARVAFLDVAEESSRSFEASLASLANPPMFFRCDLTKLEEIETVFAAIESKIGPVDVLINNAANDDRHAFGKITGAYWDERIAVNLRHQFFCAQAVTPSMKARKCGVILNVGSISWHLGLPELAIYQTAKAGIEGMTRALARELGPDCIRVNCIVPGNVKTPRQMKWYSPEGEAEIIQAQCLKGRLEPKDIAAFAMFLASDDARLITGHEYFVDAGWS